MNKLLALLLLSTLTIGLVGCAAEDAAPPPEAAKTVTDEEFEKSIANAPPEAQKRAREERAKSKGLENIGKRDK